MIRANRTVKISGFAALAVATAIALTGCQPDPEATITPTPSPTLTTSSPSPSPTEPSESPEDAATAAAEQAVRDFYAMSDASRQNPDTFNADDLKSVASTTALADAQNSLAYTLSNGQRQIGSTEITKIVRTSIDLTNDASANKIPVVEFRVCWDVSDLDVVGEDGNSVVPADRAPLGVHRVGVANYDYPSGPWTVDYTEWKEGETC